jgi:FMN phosphatase YigB (HAD superfamily)
MIRILMLDLGGTLLNQDNQPFPSVPEALESLLGFRTESGSKLELCLVSDFFPPTSDLTEDGIFEQYLEILRHADLFDFFEPVNRRVTLSTNVGVNKPDPRIFEAAIERIGIQASLDECLFITENGPHIDACRALGMTCLKFAQAGADDADFSDWSVVPQLVAGLADSEIENIEMEPRGRPMSVKTKKANKERSEDEAHFAKTLEDNKQVSHDPGPLKPGETHQETTDNDGEKRIERKRFSAF